MDKFTSMLGLCRKAGKLAAGRDAVAAALRKGQARLVFLTSDASPRHRREIVAADPDAPCVALGCAMKDLSPVFGKACCVFAVTDEHFASRLGELATEYTDNKTE